MGANPELISRRVSPPGPSHAIEATSPEAGKRQEAGLEGIGAQQAREVERGERFEFGKNWAHFLAVLDERRIAEAERSLCEFLGVERLDGKSFLDIGSGSGLFSLAARRLGARVHSFDFDPDSVACTGELRRRYFPDDRSWTVEQGSVLDRSYLTALGTFDVVYSWGVLHHTGAMWTALEHAALPVKPGGALFIAIYNDCGRATLRWLKLKRAYCKLPRPLKLPYALGVYGLVEAVVMARMLARGEPRGYLERWLGYKPARGMSRWRDMIDWIGGYPFEFASVRKLLDFYAPLGFSAARVEENPGYGCHQLVLTREA